METFRKPIAARVRARGQLTIPRDLREELELDQDAAVSITRVGKTLIITPKTSQRAALARRAEAEMKSQGITLDDLLTELKAQRTRYVDETHPKK